MRELFDFDFKRFITPSLIKVLFLFWVALQVASTLGLMGWLLTVLLEQKETREGVDPLFLGAFLSAPIGLVVSIIVGRVLAELALVAFKIEEELRLIRTR